MTTKFKGSIILVGDHNVGKSCLLNAFAHKKYTEGYIPSLVESYYQKFELEDGEEFSIAIHDTRHSEEGTTKWFNRLSGDVALMCYACDSTESLNNLLSFWYENLKELDKLPVIFLIGTKHDIIDENNPEHPPFIQVRKVGFQMKAVFLSRTSSKLYFESDFEEGNVEEIFKEAIQQVVYLTMEERKRHCCTLF